MVATRRRRQKETPPPGSFGEYISALYRRVHSQHLECPAWPPDLFAIVGSALYVTGEYRRILQPSTEVEDLVGTPEDWRKARKIGREWRKTLETVLSTGDSTTMLNDALTDPVLLGWWKVLTAHASTALNSLGQNTTVVHALLSLFFAADEACQGIGLLPEQGATESNFIRNAQYYLAGTGTRTLCLHVRPDLVCVLPKVHTAQVGLTLRSLTHNLALCRATGIEACWSGPYKFEGENPDSLNVLLLPWPTQMLPTDFRPVTGPHAQALPRDAGYFDYAPQRMPLPEFGKRLRNAIALAKANGDIHAVVFPELSLSESQYELAEQIAWEERLLLVAGVQAGDARSPQNLCAMQPLGIIESRKRLRGKLAERLAAHRLVQSKHHRWCVDERQIHQYGLGARLSPTRRWWEYMCIPPRRVNFVALGNWLTWCTLVCEDLARQDPTAELIRSVGPSLVIALLMDGPQLKARWPARYATVLSEDPGSSVLSFTNLGTVRRSNLMQSQSTQQPVATRNVIALWSDRETGTREIALQGDEDACVLSLACRSLPEFTADAHSDGGAGHVIVYAGHFPFNSALQPSGRRAR